MMTCRTRRRRDFAPLCRILILSCVLVIVAGGSLYASTGDTTADAVLGQPGFEESLPNQPDGSPTSSNLSLSNAAHLAVGPTGRLYVADTDNNRILSWPSAAGFTNGAAADMVIGQPDFVSSLPNNGGVSASALFLPQGLCVDEWGNLWVADAFNSRVLRFDNPETGATPFAADMVIGQPDFLSSAPNLGQGFTEVDAASADSLCFPGRVLVRGGHVWVADSGNSRVLHYANPTANKPSADVVLGQYGDFSCRVKNNDGTCTEKFGAMAGAQNLFNPIGLALAANGALYVSDWMNHRVLRFDDPLTSDTEADAVIGQVDFAGDQPDAGGVAFGLELPIDLFIDGTGSLYVADSGNHRVLAFLDPAGGGSADVVFGQLGSFSSDAPNHGLPLFLTDADGLWGPTGVAVDTECNLLVADTNNSRVLRFDSPLLVCADLDCDAAMTFGDVAAFVLALLDAEAHAAAHPGCETGRGDLNHDDRVDGRDISLFLSLFLGS